MPQSKHVLIWLNRFLQSERCIANIVHKLANWKKSFSQVKGLTDILTGMTSNRPNIHQKAFR